MVTGEELYLSAIGMREANIIAFIHALSYALFDSLPGKDVGKKLA